MHTGAERFPDSLLVQLMMVRWLRRYLPTFLACTRSLRFCSTHHPWKRWPQRLRVSAVSWVRSTG